MMGQETLFAARQRKRQPLCHRMRNGPSKEESLIPAQIVSLTIRKLDSTIWRSNYKANLQLRLTYLPTAVALARSDKRIDCSQDRATIWFRKEALTRRESFLATEDFARRMR